jgi:hypothetical protein
MRATLHSGLAKRFSKSLTRLNKVSINHSKKNDLIIIKHTNI